MNASNEPATLKSEPSSMKPWVIGFLLGAVVLTVLPLLQQRFLKAPPPVQQLSPWSVTSVSGGDVDSRALADKVVVLTVATSPCDADCVTRVKEFGALAHHVDDLGDRVVLVTLVDEGAADALREYVQKGSSAWRFGALEPAANAQFQAALVKFLGADSTDFARSHSLMLLDQNDAVRGFWQGDMAGRGNVVNAARLLAKHGANP